MTRLHFLGQIPLLVGLTLAVLAGFLCFVLYRRETRQFESWSARCLPWLRSIAVGLIVLMLTEPALQHRFRDGVPGQLTIVLDDSESMSLTDGKPQARYARAVEQLLDGETEILSRLSEEHDLRVVRGNSAQFVELWKATLEEKTELPTAPQDWMLDKYGIRSKLGELVEATDSSVIVLMSDGRVNDGLSLAEAIKKNPSRKQTLFAVGYGAAIAPPEMSILSVEHPDRLFRRDRLTGRVVLNDSMPAGKPFRIQAMHGDDLVWEQAIESDGTGQRAIAFGFPIEPLMNQMVAKASGQAVDASSKLSALPLSIRFQFVDDEGKALLGTRPYEMKLWGALHRSKILLVDGRSRWETRYLKNVFERDPFWEIVPVIAEAEDLLGGGPHMPSGSDPTTFPASRDELLQYDLVILGDLPISTFSDEQQKWLVDFVSEAGGGLIIVDGQRDGWVNSDRSILGTLLPVERSAERAMTGQTSSAISSASRGLNPWISLTSAGRNIAALDIREGEQSDAREVWKNLPPFHWAAKSQALPGAEVLATLGEPHQPSLDMAGKSDERPFLVTRLVGAGRVLYSASDETWRWRYKVADRIHQRFWNQVARWVMRMPYVAEGEFVSLDAGRMNYAEGESVELRCRLRKENSEPFENAQVQAAVEGAGQVPLMVNMEPHPEIPGVYRGTVVNLGPGDYRFSVSAVGVPKETLDVSTQFQVLAKTSIELNNKAVDSTTLQRVAEATGGAYLSEEELPTLVDRLQPFSQGRIIESETLLWQSYFWFVPILALLGLEWFLRKRIGLI